MTWTGCEVMVGGLSLSSDDDRIALRSARAQRVDRRDDDRVLAELGRARRPGDQAGAGVDGHAVGLDQEQIGQRPGLRGRWP